MSQLITTPNGVISIRFAALEDAAFLRELRLEALTNHPEVFSADTALAESESVETWAERLARYTREGQGVICIAITDDQLIGMSGLFRENWPKTWHSGTIWGVYVKKDWRSFHLAEAMMKECIAWAQGQGLVMVKLGVIMNNTPAIRCYARCGFTVYGIDPKVIHYNDVFYDELLMVKRI
jgi:RimJ/RimL family protein N-acetyltransferase